MGTYKEKLSAEATSSASTGISGGHEYVDLGLSVKWATCNIGASSPEGYGYYYAWGETSTKLSYDEDNCATHGKEIGDIAGTSRDVARAKWGGSWRMPTEAECKELIDNCTWTWTTRNGVNGYKVTGLNGNSIFLPAAGFGRFGTSLDHAGEWSIYWSSTPDGDDTRYSYGLYFISGHYGTSWIYRYYGRTVRPVTEGKMGTYKEMLSAEVASSASTGISGGHEYVDLGLSVKWATCNIGANSPEGYGDYYAWGETSSKSSYDEDNCTTWEKQIGDIAGTSRDVARAKWGGSWRMPTEAECEELIDNCTWTWTTRNGVSGYKVTSNKNGNSIFLPAAGHRLETSRGDAGNWGYYWNSTPSEDDTRGSYNLIFNSGYHDTDWGGRYYGCTVRPVTEEKMGTYKEKLSAEATSSASTGAIAGHEYVDLGLSVKWATCNIGASSPEGYGYYYAWGETSTKLSYDEDNCATFGKEIGDIGGTSRDVARVKWGGSWRMPTKAECEELMIKCTWTWATRNEVSGYKVTGPNGNSIFLPAAGCRDCTSLYGRGECGGYWSSTPGESDTQGAYHFYFYSSYHYTSWSGRGYGRTVRPVSE